MLQSLNELKYSEVTQPDGKFLMRPEWMWEEGNEVWIHKNAQAKTTML
jgi:hypothetical protein